MLTHDGFGVLFDRHTEVEFSFSLGVLQCSVAIFFVILCVHLRIIDHQSSDSGHVGMRFVGIFWQIVPEEDRKAWIVWILSVLPFGFGFDLLPRSMIFLLKGVPRSQLLPFFWREVHFFPCFLIFIHRPFDRFHFFAWHHLRLKSASRSSRVRHLPRVGFSRLDSRKRIFHGLEGPLASTQSGEWSRTSKAKSTMETRTRKTQNSRILSKTM
mmetsp:Transcript_9945/g.60786  ORF Transcript_9945/g.60786 Transcript_9945/m.60786 type:complete len:212 (-) Transcript_9945:3439-4074(-)